jgi:hypothetical protein
MPPRFSYWTILAGGLPTSFRAAERDDLLPTLRRLQERHPDAEMKWFQRGKLWTSPEEALSAFQKPREPRGREWRPGGEHRDPREPFKQQKRERNQARRQQRFDRKQGAGSGQGTTGHPGPTPERPQRTDRPRTDRPRTDRPRTDRPRTDRPRTDRPRADRPRTDQPRTDRPRTDRPRSERPPSDRHWSDRPRNSDRPRSDRPRTDRPRGEAPRTDRPRGDFQRNRPGSRPPSKGGRRR